MRLKIIEPLWSNWKNVFWVSLTILLIRLNWKILADLGMMNGFPILDSFYVKLQHRIRKIVRQKGKVNVIWNFEIVIGGILHLNGQWTFCWKILPFNAWIFDVYLIVHIICQCTLFKEESTGFNAHHLQLMQSVFLLIVFIAACVCCATKNMENFNINLNGSPNDSSTGSSELTNEALLELCVVGTLLTDRPVRFQYMEDRLSSLWRPGHGVTITQADDNKFIFQFYHDWDMERILQNGPWTFDGFLLVLKKVAIGEAISDVLLDEVEVWVQVFNLPLGYMNEYVGMLLGCHIGRFVKYDDSNYYGPWRMFMRMRIALNVNEPLKRSMVFEKEDGTVVNVHFKYEKIGVFCYICGIMGHTDNFCPKRLEPGYVDGAKGWGKFMTAGGRNIGGGVTVNKWLRGGRMAGRGGRDGGRGAAGGGRGEADENSANVLVTSQSSEHVLFGRVSVLRGGRFTFHRMVTTIIGHNGGGEGQWIPFELNETNIANQRAIMRLVNGINAGMNMNEGASNAGNNAGVANNVDQFSNASLAEGVCHGRSRNDENLMVLGHNQAIRPSGVSLGFSHLMQGPCMGESSEPGRVVCAKNKDKVLPNKPLIAGPLIIREGANVVNIVHVQEISKDDKGKGKMDDRPTVKKRNRPSRITGGADSSRSVAEQEVIFMNVESNNEGAVNGGNSVSIVNNPLFSENIVMAEAEN